MTSWLYEKYIYAPKTKFYNLIWAPLTITAFQIHKNLTLSSKKMRWEWQSYLHEQTKEDQFKQWTTHNCDKYYKKENTNQQN